MKFTENFANHSIFNAEQYNEPKNTDHSLIRLHIPGFSPGEGSLINMTIFTEPKSKISPDDYLDYLASFVTYDVGSISVKKPILEQVSKTATDKFAETLKGNDFYISIVAPAALAVVSGVVGTIVAGREKIKMKRHTSRVKTESSNPATNQTEEKRSPI